MIITNRHVVKNHSSIQVCCAVAQQCVDGQVIARGSEDFDVAVVEYPQFDLDANTRQWLNQMLSRLEGWGGDWAKGDVVYASGYPGGNRARNRISDPIVTEGTINQTELVPYSGGDYIEHGADVEPGSSGGPLVNSEGWIIGVNKGANRGAERLELAVPMADIIHWIETGTEPPPNPYVQNWTIEVDAGDAQSVSISRDWAGRRCEYYFQVWQPSSDDFDIRFSVMDYSGNVIQGGGRSQGTRRSFTVGRAGNRLVFDNTYSYFTPKTIDISTRCYR